MAERIEHRRPAARRYPKRFNILWVRQQQFEWYWKNKYKEIELRDKLIVFPELITTSASVVGRLASRETFNGKHEDIQKLAKEGRKEHKKRALEARVSTVSPYLLEDEHSRSVMREYIGNLFNDEGKYRVVVPIDKKSNVLVTSQYDQRYFSDNHIHIVEVKTGNRLKYWHLLQLAVTCWICDHEQVPDQLTSELQLGKSPNERRLQLRNCGRGIWYFLPMLCMEAAKIGYLTKLTRDILEGVLPQTNEKMIARSEVLGETVQLGLPVEDEVYRMHAMLGSMAQEDAIEIVSREVVKVRQGFDYLMWSFIYPVIVPVVDEINKTKKVWVWDFENNLLHYVDRGERLRLNTIGLNPEAKVIFSQMRK